MLQRDENFHNDVKLVLVYSMLNRIALKNLQNSPIGRENFKNLMDIAYSWFGYCRNRELSMVQAIPDLKSFADQYLKPKAEEEEDMLNCLAEITYFIITHPNSKLMETTVDAVVNKHYLKNKMKHVWQESRASLHRDIASDNLSTFDDWFTKNFPNDNPE